MAKRIPFDGLCPIERVLPVFGAKWKPTILFHLEAEGILRFNELRRQVSGITQRMLTNQLRELERAGLVERKHFTEIPPCVEYSLTKLGRTIGPVGQTIDQWGQKHMQRVYKARQQYNKGEN